MANLLLTLLALYIGIILLMYGLQRVMLYHPSRQIEAPASYGLSGFSEETATAADGTKLQLWYRKAKAGMPTVAYFHGNAYHVGGRAAIYDALAARGFGVLALSYRGYGKSDGSPTEDGLYMDARAALAWLAEKQIPTAHTLLFGESLGTGVAVQMATEYPIGMLILEAPYTAVEDRASELYRFIPVRLMIKDKFRSIDKIGRIKAPLLLFHGELDGIIPVHHGRALLAAAPEPKQAYFFPLVHHNDFDSALISEHVLGFARQHKLVNE